MARDWAVRHPDGQVTVGWDGTAMSSLRRAKEEAVRYDLEMEDSGCSQCAADEGVHVVVFREVPPPPPWETYTP